MISVNDPPPPLAALQGDFAAAAANLQTCLSVLGRALPTSRLDLACSLSWNVIRYSLQKLRLVRWLLRKVFQRRRAAPPATAAGFEDEAKASARDAALAYHRLHQLHITGEGGCPCPAGPRAVSPPRAWFACSLPRPEPFSWCSPRTPRQTSHIPGYRHGSLP